MTGEEVSSTGSGATPADAAARAGSSPNPGRVVFGPGDQPAPAGAPGSREAEPPRASSLTRATLGGFFWTLSSAGVQALLQILVLVILARMLPPSSFGLVQAALVVVGFSAIFSQLGVGPAIVQREALEIRHLRTGFTLSLLLGAAMTAAVWLLAGRIAAFFRIEELAPVARAMSVVFVIQGGAVVAESLLQRELRFRWLSFIEVVTFAVGFGLTGVTLAFAGAGPWALVGAHIAQNLTKTVVLLIAQPHPMKPLLEWSATRDLMYFGSGFTVARIGNYLAGQADSLIVGRWLGAEALGLYGRAYQLMTAPAMLFGQAVDRVLFPAMAKVQSDPARLRVAYRRSVALVALVMLPLSACLVVLAPEVVRTLLGPSWDRAILPFRILASGLLLRTSYKMSDSIARATGAVYRRAWRQCLFALLVTAGAWLGRPWGIPGVACGVLAAIAINFLAMAELSLKLAEMRWSAFLSSHLPALALAALVMAETWAVAQALRGWGLPPGVVMAVSGTLALATTLVAIWSVPGLFLGEERQWILHELATYLPGGAGGLLRTRGTREAARRIHVGPPRERGN